MDVAPQLFVVQTAAVRREVAKLFKIERMQEPTEAVEVVAGWFGETKAIGTEFLLEEASNGPRCTRHVKIHFQRRASYQSSGTVAEFGVIATHVQALVHAYAMNKGVRPQCLDSSFFSEGEDSSGVCYILSEGQVALLLTVTEQVRRGVVVWLPFFSPSP